MKKHLFRLTIIVPALAATYSSASATEPSQRDMAACLNLFDRASKLILESNEEETAAKISKFRFDALNIANNYYNKNDFKRAQAEAILSEKEIDISKLNDNLKLCINMTLELKSAAVSMNGIPKPDAPDARLSIEADDAPKAKTAEQIMKEKIQTEKIRLNDEKLLIARKKQEEADKKAEEKAAAAEAKKMEIEKVAAAKAEKLRIANAPKECKKNYLMCSDVAMLIKNYAGIPRARKDCEERTGDIAKWQYRFQSSPSFTIYWNSEYEMEKIQKDGILRLSDDSALFQNGFGAWKSQRVVCYYDIQNSRALYVNPE